MARACTAKAHQIAPLMRLSDLELKLELDARIHEDPVGALHLCHELLSALELWPSRASERMPAIIGSALVTIGHTVQNSPRA